LAKGAGTLPAESAPSHSGTKQLGAKKYTLH
jgi:hypothetical protein